MTIEKGDRVRVHADGDVIQVDSPREHGALIGKPPGALFGVALQLREEEGMDVARGQRRERLQENRSAWFYEDEVEPTLDKPLVEGNGWRDVCADMIREGADSDALAQLVVNSPDVAEYIRLLEMLEATYGLLMKAAMLQRAQDVSRDEYLTALSNSRAAVDAVSDFRKTK